MFLRAYQENTSRCAPYTGEGTFPMPDLREKHILETNKTFPTANQKTTIKQLEQRFKNLFSVPLVLSNHDTQTVNSCTQIYEKLVLCDNINYVLQTFNQALQI
jgi:hypothetical protein